MTEGATEKVSQFIIPMKSVYNKHLSFNEQEYFRILQKGWNTKTSL